MGNNSAHPFKCLVRKMKLLIPTRIQWITLFFPFPLIVFFIYYLLFNDIELVYYQYIILFLLSLSLGCFSWYVSVVSNNVICSLFPGLHQTAERVLCIFLIHSCLDTGLLSMIFFGFDITGFFGYHFDRFHFISAIVSAVLFNVIFCTIWQAEYIFYKWKESIEMKELMEQQFLQQEYDQLKRQINPHFLFNNFNILSSLINENPSGAIYYLDELSKVYRYLLRTAEDGISTLKDELAFIRSYGALLNIRYGKAVQLHILPDNDCLAFLIPSLTLQLLVENAIKHNISSKASPLVIVIYTQEDNRIIVKNNLQKKTIPVPSDKIGLANIFTKYKLLNFPDVRIIKEELYFSVSLPLIENRAADLQEK